MTGIRGILAVAIFLSMGGVSAGQDEGGGAGGPPVHPKGPRNARDLPGASGLARDFTVVRIERILDEVKLDEQQKPRAAEFIEDFKVKQEEIRGRMTAVSGGAEELNALRQQLVEARRANDEAKMKELLDEFRRLRQEQQKQMLPMRKELSDLRTSLKTNLETVMNEEQKKEFETLWARHFEKQGGYGGQRRSPQALHAAIDRLKDLSEEQKRQFEALFEEFKTASRTEPTATRQKLVDRLYDQVTALLSEEQKKEIETLLRGRMRADEAGGAAQAGAGAAGAGGDGGKPAEPPSPGDPAKPTG